jgi:hypothetical protein
MVSDYRAGFSAFQPSSFPASQPFAKSEGGMRKAENGFRSPCRFLSFPACQPQAFQKTEGRRQKPMEICFFCAAFISMLKM